MNFHSLKNHPSVVELDIVDYRHWSNGSYYYVKISLKNNLILHAREYFDIKNHSYSFHCQNEKNELITRWDNSPHHPELNTFPHHRHDKDVVVNSLPVSLIEVLDYILKM